jgi:hypothetical protein
MSGMFSMVIPTLALPKGSQWEDIGKKESFSLYVVFGILIMKFLCHVFKTNEELSKMQMWHLSGLRDHLQSRGVERQAQWQVEE